MDDKEKCGCGNDHDEDCGCEQDTLMITLDDDTEVECNVIGIFEVGDKEYIALLPLDDETVLLYQYEDEDDNVNLNSIEDDDEFKAVTDMFFELFNDDEEFAINQEEDEEDEEDEDEEEE